MMSRNTVFATALLAAGGLTLSACEHSQAVATTSAANSVDANFITNAYNIIEFDNQEAGIVAQQGKDARVRALAAQFLQQANDFRSGLAPAAQAAGIKPPTALREDLRQRLYHLSLNNGLGLDQSFIEDQIASHTDAINAQSGMLDNPGSNPRLAAFSRRGTVILRENLAKLRSLQRSFATEGKPS